MFQPNIVQPYKMTSTARAAELRHGYGSAPNALGGDTAILVSNVGFWMVSMLLS
jgi:hypothetical protein